MFRACVLLFLVAPLLLAADKPKTAPKPIGSWEREVSGNTIAFTFNADNSLSIKLASGEFEINIQGHYSVTPDGIVFGIMDKVEAKGTDNGPEKGDLFSFRIALSKDELKISELGGTKNSEDAQRLIEGSYKKK